MSLLSEMEDQQSLCEQDVVVKQKAALVCFDHSVIKFQENYFVGSCWSSCDNLT